MFYATQQGDLKMAENKKYYDIEVDALFEKGYTTIDDCFYLKDLKQRKLFIDDEICQETGCTHIYRLWQDG